MIAESPDAMQAAASCAWCHEPLRSLAGGVSPAQLRCAVCGSRTGAGVSDAELARAVAAAGRPQDGARRCTAAEALRRRARRRLAERVARMAPPGAVLDVGSGDGTLLDALRQAGRVATGIGRPATRPDVHDADITELGGRYAAIVFWQSLGRAPAPRTALDHAVALLKPDGVLTIAQPTTVGLPALTERLRGVAQVRPAVQIPQRALVERLRSLGLEVLRADRVVPRDGGGLGTWPASLLGGVVSVEARR